MAVYQGTVLDEGGAIFNVKSYGAEGNVVVAPDAQTSSSSYSFTSSQLVPFASAQTIIIADADQTSTVVISSLSVSGTTWTASLAPSTAAGMCAGQPITIAFAAGHSSGFTPSPIGVFPIISVVCPSENSTYPASEVTFTAVTATGAYTPGSLVASVPSPYVGTIAAPFTQTFSIVGTPTGGHFNFAASGVSGTSANIIPTASASMVASLLNSWLGAGSVTVTSSATGVWTIAWTGAGVMPAFTAVNTSLLTPPGTTVAYEGTGTLTLNTTNTLAPTTVAITGVSLTTNTVTLTLASVSGIYVGRPVTVAGISGFATPIAGTFPITAVNATANTISFSFPSSPFAQTGIYTGGGTATVGFNAAWGHDDSSAVTTALQQADAAGGGMVWFPAGIYFCSNVNPGPGAGSHVHLCGAGEDCTVLLASNVTNSSGMVLKIPKDCEVSDLTIDGGYMGGGTGTGLGLLIDAPSGAIVDKVELRHVTLRNISQVNNGSNSQLLLRVYDNNSNFQITNLVFSDLTLGPNSNPFQDSMGINGVRNVKGTNLKCLNLCRTPNFFVFEQATLDGVIIRDPVGAGMYADPEGSPLYPDVNYCIMFGEANPGRIEVNNLIYTDANQIGQPVYVGAGELLATNWHVPGQEIPITLAAGGYTASGTYNGTGGYTMIVLAQAPLAALSSLSTATITNLYAVDSGDWSSLNGAFPVSLVTSSSSFLVAVDTHSAGQLIVNLGAPSSGYFTLSYGGQTTGHINYAASAATVQSNLQGLSTIGSGNATVTGPAGGPYTIGLAGTLNPTLITAVSGLAGGTGITLTSNQYLFGATASFDAGACYVDLNVPNNSGAQPKAKFANCYLGSGIQLETQMDALQLVNNEIGTVVVGGGLEGCVTLDSGVADLGMLVAGANQWDTNGSYVLYGPPSSTAEVHVDGGTAEGSPGAFQQNVSMTSPSAVRGLAGINPIGATGVAGTGSVAMTAQGVSPNPRWFDRTFYVAAGATVARSDATGVSFSSSSAYISDSHCVANDQSKVVTGTNIPASCYAGNVTPGTGFTLYSTPVATAQTTATQVLPTGVGTSLTVTAGSCWMQLGSGVLVAVPAGALATIRVAAEQTISPTYSSDSPPTWNVEGE